MIKLNSDVEVTFELENRLNWELKALSEAFIHLCSTTGLHLQFKRDRLLIKGDVGEVAGAADLVKQKIEEYKPK